MFLINGHFYKHEWNIADAIRNPSAAEDVIPPA